MKASTLMIVGLLLLSGGIYSTLDAYAFDVRAIKTQAKIRSVKDEAIVGRAYSIYHMCRYSISYILQNGTKTETKSDNMENSSCWKVDDVIDISYDPKAPQVITYQKFGDSFMNVGTLLIIAGILFIYRGSVKRTSYKKPI
jgi:hypothetical protein